MSNYIIGGELHSITTFDGLKLVIDNPVFYITFGGYGAPPTDFITRAGYLQDGVDELDYFLGVRDIQVQLRSNVDENTSNRQAYWDERARLHNFLRPNRGGPLTFTIELPNGDLRSLLVRANPGLVLPTEPTDTNDWDINETISFRAFNPVWFADTETVTADSTNTVKELIFPISFPIFFGDATGYIIGANFANYEGTWKSYPRMVLNGPFTDATITNYMTGAIISVTGEVLSGDSRIIETAIGQQSVIDNYNVDRFNEISPESNFVDFYIPPEPELSSSGQPIIQVQFFGTTTGATSFDIIYSERFFAI